MGGDIIGPAKLEAPGVLKRFAGDHEVYTEPLRQSRYRDHRCASDDIFIAKNGPAATIHFPMCPAFPPSGLSLFQPRYKNIAGQVNHFFPNVGVQRKPNERSEERRVGKEGRSQRSPY